MGVEVVEDVILIATNRPLNGHQATRRPSVSGSASVRRLAVLPDLEEQGDHHNPEKEERHARCCRTKSCNTGALRRTRRAVCGCCLSPGQRSPARASRRRRSPFPDPRSTTGRDCSRIKGALSSAKPGGLPAQLIETDHLAATCSVRVHLHVVARAGPSSWIDPSAQRRTIGEQARITRDDCQFQGLNPLHDSWAPRCHHPGRADAMTLVAGSAITVLN